jgi:hypothetical protein
MGKVREEQEIASGGSQRYPGGIVIIVDNSGGEQNCTS